MLLFTVFGFLLGSIPFALIIAKLFALKAGGLKIGIPAILLEIAKGFLPVYLARRYGVSGWDLVPVCLAPALGHAFSPFLKFRGGKALGATGGAWVGLIGLWAFPVYGALAVPFTIVQSEDAWSAMAGMLSLIGYSILVGEPWMVAFAILNTVLIAFTHRRALVNPPQARAWIARMFTRREA
jgi:glycerol-3-phosphate acyltransferase PlsY